MVLELKDKLDNLEAAAHGRSIGKDRTGLQRNRTRCSVSAAEFRVQPRRR